MAAIRQQAFRELPQVAVGSAWRDTALVNAQVILWAETSTARVLPDATVVGRQVGLRISGPQARWNFGDGVSGNGLGKPYDGVHDPCRTVQCPDYYGHTYRQTGRMDVQLRVSWAVQYRLGDGDWVDLPGGALTGPVSRHVITVKQAHGVLVDDAH